MDGKTLGEQSEVRACRCTFMNERVKSRKKVKSFQGENELSVEDSFRS